MAQHRPKRRTEAYTLECTRTTFLGADLTEVSPSAEGMRSGMPPSPKEPGPSAAAEGLSALGLRVGDREGDPPRLPARSLQARPLLGAPSDSTISSRLTSDSVGGCLCTPTPPFQPPLSTSHPIWPVTLELQGMQIMHLALEYGRETGIKETRHDLGTTVCGAAFGLKEERGIFITAAGTCCIGRRSRDIEGRDVCARLPPR